MWQIVNVSIKHFIDALAAPSPAECRNWSCDWCCSIVATVLTMFRTQCQEDWSVVSCLLPECWQAALPGALFG